MRVYSAIKKREISFRTCSGDAGAGTRGRFQITPGVACAGRNCERKLSFLHGNLFVTGTLCTREFPVIYFIPPIPRTDYFPPGIAFLSSL